MPSRDMIGRILSTGTATVAAEHVAAFARALGDLNPRYLDSGGSSGVVAPPTYPIAFMTLVHGEQEFEYLRPVRAGETLTLTGRVADIYEKSGSSGTLDFVVLETEARDTE